MSVFSSHPCARVAAVVAAVDLLTSLASNPGRGDSSLAPRAARGRWRRTARVLAVLSIGSGLLAGAAPAEAQNRPAPTRFRAEAVRHVDGGDAEVDLTWLHPTGAGATGFTVHYQLARTNREATSCATTPADPTTNLGQQGR